MYQVGDTVSYGISGVCTITDKQRKNLAGVWQDCYILKPLYDHSMTICIPCESKALVERMRPLLSKKELMELLHQPTPELDQDPAQRKQVYREILQSGDRSAMAAMVRQIYSQRQMRRQQGKHLPGFEETVLREAENALNTEFAYVLGIAPDAVPEFITSELGQGAAQ